MASLFKRKLPGGGYSWVVAVKTQKKGQEPISLWRTFDTEEDAQKFKRDIENELKTHATTAHKKHAVTFAALIQKYRENVLPTRKNPKPEHYKLNTIEKYFPCHKIISQIAPTDIATYRDKRLKEATRTTVTHELALITRIFNLAAQEWGFDTLKNPAQTVRKPRFNEPRDRRVTDDEIQKIVSHTESPMLADIIRLAVETAMRQAEFTQLTWKMVSFTQNTITLPGSTTKTGKKRVIPLSEKATDILQALYHKKKEEDERIFPVAPHSLATAFRRAAKRANIEDIHFHDMRHEAISRFVEMGLSIPEISGISGHATLQMLARYSHPSSEHLVAKLRNHTKRE